MGKLFFQDVFATRISELTGFDVPYGLSCDDLDVGDALKLKIQDIKFLVSKNSENEITVCTKIKKLGDGALNNVYCAIETKYRPNSSPSRPCLIALKKPSYKNNRISDPQTTDKEFQENFKHDIKKEIRYARACASPLSPHRVSTTDTKIYMHSTLMCSDLCTFVYDHLPASLRSAFAIEVLK